MEPGREVHPAAARASQGPPRGRDPRDRCSPKPPGRPGLCSAGLGAPSSASWAARTGPAAPGDELSFQRHPRARERSGSGPAHSPVPCPLSPKPGIRWALEHPRGCLGHGGQLGRLLGRRDELQNVPLKGRGSVLLQRE